MQKYIIERDIPALGALTPAELQAVSQKSCTIIDQLRPQLQWVESYVTADKLYCVYLASSEEAIREHAKRGGFPANRISRVLRLIDPTTAHAA
ncbi:MAG TPA: DUF4242 domain-containing protein [Acidobacteriota bacterium]|nr:DUF4242 domain-containing protein [Acidobacteriota bacterium]